MLTDQSMMETLSGTLSDREKLLYPVFGYVKKDGFQQFAYFAFTETHFLIVYLSGNQIIDTIRIPLNILTVKIRKSKILREYIIDILFSNNKSYTISAFAEVLKIKSQKDNLPLFLEHLKAVAKERGQNLENISGDKIRWQYFNTYICMMLAFVPITPIIIVVSELKKGNSNIIGILSEMTGAIPTLPIIYGIFLGPFIFLSFFNRFCFGQILAVVKDNTLYLENREISLDKIERIIYHPSVLSRCKISSSYATIELCSQKGKKEQFDVLHLPLYALRKIKKHNSNIRLSYDKYIWFLLFAPTLISSILALIL